jgi:hypothetical protein
MLGKKTGRPSPRPDCHGQPAGCSPRLDAAVRRRAEELRINGVSVTEGKMN